MKSIDGVSSGGENDVKGLLTGAEHKKVGGGEKLVNSMAFRGLPDFTPPLL